MASIWTRLIIPGGGCFIFGMKVVQPGKIAWREFQLTCLCRVAQITLHFRLPTQP